MPLVINYIENKTKKYYNGNEKTPLGRGYSSFFEKVGTVKKGKDGYMYKVRLINNIKKWIPLKKSKKNKIRSPRGLFNLKKGGYLLDPYRNSDHITVKDLDNKYIFNRCNYFPSGYSFKLVNTYSLAKGFDEPLFTAGLIACSALLFTDKNDGKNYIFHDSENSESWNNRAIVDLRHYKRTPITAYIILGQVFPVDTLTKYLTNLRIKHYIFYAPNERYKVFTGIEDDKLLCGKYDGDPHLLYENETYKTDGYIDVKIDN